MPARQRNDANAMIVNATGTPSAAFGGRAFGNQS
jgi:hypothetical protein